MIFFLLFYCANTLQCNTYQCAPKAFTFPNDLSCFNQTNTTVYLQPCPTGKICNLETNLCETKPKPESTPNYPGEYCLYSSTCLSGSCIRNICEGKSFDQPCNDNEDCNPGLRCHQKICTNTLLSGQSGCVNDYDCANSAGCNISSTTGIGTCLEYLSVSTGSIVSDCSGGQSRLCKTSECAKTGKFGTYGTCKVATQSVDYLPVKCTDNLNCTGTDGKSMYTGICSCGYNANGTAFCNPFNGDLPGVAYYLSWKNALNASVGVCNTLRRFSSECLQKTGFLAKITSTSWNFLFYPQIQNNDPCVEETVNYEYYGEISFAGFLYVWLVGILGLG